MSFHPKSFTLPNQVLLSHNLLHKHTSDLQQFEIYQDASEQSNVQIKFLTQCIQPFSPHFTPQTREKSGKIEWTNLLVSAESHFLIEGLG
jgi:hypothetical protein